MFLQTSSQKSFLGQSDSSIPRLQRITDFTRFQIASTAAAAAKSLQSCPTLCDPVDGSPPGQGGLACCSPCGCKESDMTELLNWTESTGKFFKCFISFHLFYKLLVKIDFNLLPTQWSQYILLSCLPSWGLVSVFITLNQWSPQYGPQTSSISTWELVRNAGFQVPP